MKSFFNRGLFLAAGMLSALMPAAHAQNEQDALRLSFLQPQGTARSIGFGSALGSVGGDFTSLSVNPAGIGVYRRSEFTITPSLMFSNTNADYANNTDEASSTRFSISNIGLVTTQVARGRRAARTGWTSVSFGLGLTRLADFTRAYNYSGTNSTSSGSFVFESDANANGTHGENVSLADLGYQSYLINRDSAGVYYSVVDPKADAPVSQLTSVTERGGISELGISLGGSYQDRLMLGATLGFPIVRFIRNKTFTERDLNNVNPYFDYFTYHEDLKTTGAGINLKLGFIYKPTDNFRFGAAIHTPSYYSLTDVQDQDIIANTESYQGIQGASLVQNQYDYNLSSPWRGVVSATGFFGSNGFITADYEFVDYGSARFTFDDKSYQRDVNNYIKQSLGGASNVRLGLELRLDNFQLRGGFGYYGNPYKSNLLNSQNANGERLDFSAGFGFRFANAFIDFGFVHHQYTSIEQPYYLSGTTTPGSWYYGLVVPTANLKTNNNNAVVTFGFKL